MNIRIAQAAASKIPGNTLEEKISWLQTHLDTELGQMYASGTVSYTHLTLPTKLL
jgi:hypothetical protein